MRSIAILAAAAFAAPASGAILTWTAEGTVSTLVETPGFTGGATEWSLTMTIDTTTPDLDPDALIGRYAITAELTLGLVNETFDTFFQVGNVPGTDLAGWGYPTLSVIPGWTGIGFVFDLAGPDTLFSSDAVPDPLPDFATFGVSSSSINMLGNTTGGQSFQLSGSVTSLVATPAPGTLTLLGLTPLMTRRHR